MSASAALLVLAVVAVAWLTAAAVAVRSVSRIWLRAWAERRLEGVPAAASARPRRLLAAASGGVALVAVLAGAVLGATEPGAARLAVRIVALAVLLLVAGQLVPRTLARHWPTRLVPVLVPPLGPLAVVLAPVAAVTRRAVRRLAGGALATREEPARDRIEDLLREGELEGIGGPAERDIITGIVAFGEKLARDVMTPRTEIFAVSESLSPREVALAVEASGYSRVPVYHETLDEIVGMIHVFDVLAAGPERQPAVRPVTFAPATTACSDLLREMRRRQVHLVVVLDEYGGTAGIVTLEDVLEELVGEITDEHDEPRHAVPSLAGAAVVLDGAAELDDVARRFDVEIPEELGADARTVGGIIARRLGRIPAAGERFLLAGLEITIVDAEPARVVRVLVQRTPTRGAIALGTAV